MVEQDFHGNIQVSVTWFFACFFSLGSLTELCSFWYALKGHFTLHQLDVLTIKSDGITSG